MGAWFEGLSRSPVILLYAVALSVSGLAIGGEALWGWLRRRELYTWRDTLANGAMYAGYFGINLVWVHAVFAIYAFAHDHALIQVGVGGWHVGWVLWWEWVLLLILDDFCFYWFHRSSHTWRFLWASHVNHHSSDRFNLSVAFRQTWTPFFAVVFWLPLPLIGFDPLMVMTMQALSLFYQSALHTQLAPRLGPLEWVLNTPRHHRVHHGANDAYLNRNMGGVLIVWDRLFGTFAREVEPIRYGLHEPLETHNPLRIAFHEWAAMIRDVASPGSLRERLVRLVR